MTRGKQSFMKGAAILGVAALFTKLLGAVYRIPYQNITGNEGMFVYQQVYPLYSTLLILATAGFPIAISKLVSERLAQGDVIGAQRIFRVTTTALTVTGLFFFLLLYTSAPLIAQWMGSEALLTLPIRAVSFALLIVPLMSVIRGYFQGQQNMTPTAASQVAEQSVRVTTILLLSWWFMSTGAGVVYAGAGAVFGAFTGAVAGLILLLIYWGRNRRLERQQVVREPVSFAKTNRESPWAILRTLMMLSIPISIGALVLPLFSLVDSFTVANLLEKAGFTTAAAIDGKGVYDRGQPLIQFAAFFATALSLSIVPAVAEARIRGEERKVRERASLALRLTLLFGLPASVGLAVVAGPTNVMLYKDDAGTAALAILAFTALFSTLGMTSSGILQGVGQVSLPARNLLIGVGVKFLLNLFLIPLWDIRGAAVATVTGYAVATTLNLLALRGKLGNLFRLKRTGFSMVVATGLMIVAVVATMKGTLMGVAGWESTRLAMTVVSLTGVTAGALVYGSAALFLGVMEPNELMRIPKIGPKLAGFLDQYGWNRKGRSRDAG
jgi:PST family polysaccharide transporter